MTAGIRIAMFATVIACGAIASAAQPAAPADVDNMTPYRMLAADTMKAFTARDMPGAKTKAKALEVAWDTHEKALEKKSPDLWGQIDKAMDAFIKPVLGKSPDPVKVQTAYDTFIATLQLAVKRDAEPKR
jgi:hypothetical protein